VLLPLICALVGGAAFGSTPRSLVTTVIERAPTDMPADSIAVSAAVFNGHAEPVIVAFAPEQREGLALEVTPSMVTLLPGQRVMLRSR
jgi:hypothetical protein